MSSVTFGSVKIHTEFIAMVVAVQAAFIEDFQMDFHELESKGLPW